LYPKERFKPDYFPAVLFDMHQLVQEAAFGDGSAYGSSAMSHNLKKLSLEEVLQYRKAQFVAGNVVVVSSGGVSQANLEGAINKHAKLLPAGQGSTPAAPKFVGGEVKVRTDLEGNSRLAVAFPVPAGDAGKQLHRSRHVVYCL
jgi:predicted Zn-dependent peptidase